MIVLAELLSLFMIEKFGAHYIIFTFPPLYKFQIFIEFSLTVEKQLILLYIFTCEVVTIETIHTLIRTSLRPYVRYLMPVILVES